MRAGGRGTHARVGVRALLTWRARAHARRAHNPVDAPAGSGAAARGGEGLFVLPRDIARRAEGVCVPVDVSWRCAVAGCG